VKLAGFTIYVRDWPAAVAWYRDVLGLPVVAFEEDDQFCMLGVGSGFLGLATDHPEYAVGEHENRLAPSLAVDDLDATLATLRERGVRVDDRIDGEGEGYRLSRFWDLEGNRINVFTSS
jgi:catechol 2,3-dioxygenase-like lactoylglutathione lyase family enzyme